MAVKARTQTVLERAMERFVASLADGVSHRERLEALRDYLALSIIAAPADKRAPLAKQYSDTLAAIEALPTEKERSTSDDLTAKRDARRAAAKAAHPARRSGG